ncbi:MAG: alpha/beta fold hydrolase [Saprospiraceae bacterium]|nr:alpha/beta fold hydrolase [Saprospiraceae bacterium]
MKHKLKFLLSIGFVFLLMIFGCSSENDIAPVLVQKPEFLPIVMIHGALASGDTYAKHSMLFGSNAYDNALLYVFDWNSLGGGNAQAISALDSYIDKILATTGKNKIYLIGHSAGGGLGYSYCSVAARAQKVQKYVHLASNTQTKPAGPIGEIPTFNVYSKADKVVNGSDIVGAVNTVFDDLDHYQVATSEKSFEKIFNFLLGEIANPVITRQAEPKISGRVVTLGENKAVSNVSVKVFIVDGLTGNRVGDPVAIFLPDPDGYFGPLKLNPEMHHEFEITSSDPDFRTLHYYREPIIRDNKFLYLRTFPPVASLAGILLSNLPKDDGQAVVAVFSSNQAVINGRDSLFIQKIDLVTPALCSPQNSTIAMFLYDNGDKISSGNPHAAFSIIPFLKGADIYNGTPCSETITIRLNGSVRGVKNYKSATEGVVIVVFD